MPIKKILSFLIASFVAFFLGGCGGPPTVATISIIGENSSTLQAMMSLKDSFESRNPSIHLQFNPNTFEEARTKSDQDFVEKKGQYDIILQYNFTLSSSVRNNYVYMINDLTKDIPAEKKSFESDIFPNLWNELGYYYNDALNPTAGKKMVSYPYIGISMVLMYNKPMFENEANKADYQKKYGQPLNVPSSWEDMLKAAEFFTDRQKGTFGICMEGAAFYLNPEWTNFLGGMGGTYFDKATGWEGDENTPLRINSTEAKNALRTYLKFKPYNSGNYTDVDQARQMQLMVKGNTAMAIVWTDMLYPYLKSDTGFSKTFGFTTIPGNKSILCGGAYFINRQSHHPKEAAAYVVDQLQPSVQIELAKRGLCSPLQSVYKDPEVRKIPYTDALYESLKRGGMFLQSGPDADAITEVIEAYIQRAWNNELSPEDALDKAYGEIVQKRTETFRKLRGNK